MVVFFLMQLSSKLYDANPFPSVWSKSVIVPILTPSLPSCFFLALACERTSIETLSIKSWCFKTGECDQEERFFQPENLIRWGSERVKKSDDDTPHNYRGISLPSKISKVFTSILNKKLYTWAKKENKTSEEQAGFR